MKTKAYLFGPFFGEASWEFFRFAPYAIYLKKTEPDKKMVVLTRQSRFDLYGKYADILVPLNIRNEHIFYKKAFKLVGYDLSFCKQTEDIFRIKYKNRFEIINHFCPNVASIKYKLKWQFPRGKMDYDFKPRPENFNIVKSFVKNKKFIIIDKNYEYTNSKYETISIETFFNDIVISNKKTSLFGCLIELIKNSLLVISNPKSDVGHLALLLKKPLIYVNSDMLLDSINLLNPLKTPIIYCSNIEEGIKKYENNF